MNASRNLSKFTFTFIYIYAFSRRFYPKKLTVHSGYTFFISMCVPWELNPQPFALLTQFSITEPQERESNAKYVFQKRHSWTWTMPIIVLQQHTLSDS